MPLSPQFWEEFNSFPYLILVRWSRDDDAYVAEVPAVAGAGGDGQTLEEAVRAAKESVRVQLEVREKHRDPVPPLDTDESEGRHV